ncbi:Asp/Glu racemase [Hypericibacter adhaerens]|uniref:Asp/Glu racemase n=1 Tax=Hypericibacter adhaerens TaxID=2602016 RepID=A0A5J6MY92_9PROT|nr:aspartate/glutamate racemase family protein [Hypericibacter adhaerens]QEX22539.1 Asp/Glu racemase [Hypericibacter adhaerens]
MNETALRRPATGPINKTHMKFALDGGVASRCRIGLIVLATDHTIEAEWRQVIRLPGVAVYESRIQNSPEINPETLAAMEKDLGKAASVILPGIELDVIGYGCTSASVVMGEETVARRIQEARPGVAVTNPITAAITGMKKLGARRIALLTPYIEAVNQRFRGYIEGRGLEVTVMGSFNHENDNEVARISTASIRDAMIELAQEPTVDGIFVSCTSLRVADIVEEVEQKIGKPVTSSNLALAWHCLRLAGIEDRLPGYGQLFRS